MTGLHADQVAQLRKMVDRAKETRSRGMPHDTTASLAQAWAVRAGELEAALASMLIEVELLLGDLDT